MNKPRSCSHAFAVIMVRGPSCACRCSIVLRGLGEATAARCVMSASCPPSVVLGWRCWHVGGPGFCQEAVSSFVGVSVIEQGSLLACCGLALAGRTLISASIALSLLVVFGVLLLHYLCRCRLFRLCGRLLRQPRAAARLCGLVFAGAVVAFVAWFVPAQVVVPKSRNTFCPAKECRKHALHKVTQYKTGKASKFAQGKRRYDRKQSGYGGQTKPVFHKKVRGAFWESCEESGTGFGAPALDLLFWECLAVRCVCFSWPFQTGRLL